jgi:2-iminobutanoate/2-iminopropanoate deaminase
VGAQTRQCFANLFSVLAAAGLDSSAVVRVGVFLTDMSDFEEMNAAYAGHFSEPYPARTTIGVAALPLGASVEIELTAQL